MPDSSSLRHSAPEPEKTTELQSPGGSADSDGANSSATESARTAPQGEFATQAIDFSDQTLGDFRLLRKLGRGGMADVYLADQTTLDRQVAVKILHENLRSDNVHRERFVREAKAAGGLHHPNIVQVFVIGEEGGTHYIAQEYVQGWNLREHLNRNGPPDAVAAIHIIRQVTSALQAAAEAGVVHRDIKPENILITRKGEVKVTDFGLAQLVQTGDRVDLTQVGVTMGTPLYMSPEQINGKKLDQRSDMYSFGVTCYHMLAGQPPFHGETAMSVAVQHVNKEPPPLADRRRDLPPELCRLVHRMMAKEPDQRYADFRLVLEDLREIARDVQNQAGGNADLSLSQFSMPILPANHLKPPLIARLRLWCRGTQGIFVFSVLLICIAGGGVGWFMRPADPFETPPAPSATSIPKKNSAAEQYDLALFLKDNLEAWEAAANYFPDDAKDTPEAKRVLIFFYIHLGRYQDAAEEIAELKVFGDKDNRFMAYAHAADAVLASLDRDYARSEKLIYADFRPLLNELPVQEGPGPDASWDEDPRTYIANRLDGDVAQLLIEAMQRNSELRGELLNPILERLLKTTGNGLKSNAEGT